MQGDFARETAYGDDPIATSASLVETGVPWLHLVDLDGARAGAPRQARLIADIVAAVGRGADCQVAGGLREDAAVQAAFETGAARVVVGTAALAEPAFAGRLVERWGVKQIACAIDVRAGRVVGNAWQGGERGDRPEDAIRALAAVGVRRFVVTAIERDGLLQGPDLDLLERVVRLDDGAVIASGGIRSIEDLLAVRGLGCAGAIVGRAIYEGQLELADAVRGLATGT
jgi:phosphoribosylformimino-5-aminoimidazole carboxamide ribotide isomerase